MDNSYQEQEIYVVCIHEYGYVLKFKCDVMNSNIIDKLFFRGQDSYIKIFDSGVLQYCDDYKEATKFDVYDEAIKQRDKIFATMVDVRG